MKLKTTLAALAIAAMTVAAAPASWANSLTFQNVTFGLNEVGGNVQLTIDNALNATGDWSDIMYMNAFEVKNLGTVSSMTLANWTNRDNSLSANGCSNGNTSGGCFT